ncbi:hypothetical protein RND81_03G144400 [Saponaria officinalis]|uniref:GRF-type domain-containing protein n=1 Tax=Saponaria officinalis TaxID=3572 RepID=A0AAW1M6V8_SAPOF
MSEINKSSGCVDVNKCFCGIPVTVKKSSTSDNPGRRFETCKFYNPVTKLGGCNYFRWFDRVQTDWQRVIINNQNMRENLLTKDLELKQEDLANVKEEKNRLSMEVERLKKKVKTVKEENSRLKGECSNRNGIPVTSYVLLCVLLVCLARLF